MISKSFISSFFLCFVVLLSKTNSSCVKNIQVQLIIESNETVTSKIYSIASGSNVIQLLEIDRTLGTSDSHGFGPYVDAIDGVYAHWVPNQQFWELIVNSKVSDLSASNYILQPNDVITWKIVTYDPNTDSDLK